MGFLQKDLERAKMEKERCSKQYSDWKDDEYNMGPLKFIFAVPFYYKDTPSFCSLNDLIIYYNRDNKKYFLDIDIESPFNSLKYRISLIDAVDKFKSFLRSQENIEDKDLIISKEKYIECLSLLNSENYWIEDSLLGLYYKCYVFLNSLRVGKDNFWFD